MSQTTTAGRAQAADPVDLYVTIARIREFELAASRLTVEGALSGSVHVSIGQEAVAAGVCRQLRPDDYLTTTHRGHGHCLAKGGDVRRMMAELMGRADGYCKGRSGSMHIAAADLGILGANAIMAAGLPMAVGAGYAALVRGTDQVAVAFLGEGAVGEGAFHESLNLAALWRVPVVFVCENNQYAELSHVSLHLANPVVSSYAASYGIPGVRVDGNDALAVRDAFGEALARARSGQGPTLLECDTYRLHGHFEGDQQQYRTKDEVESWRARDPLDALGARLAQDGTLDPAAQRRIREDAAEEMRDAVEFAKASPLGGPELLVQDVYAPGATGGAA